MVTKRATQLGLILVTQREVSSPEETIDLSDEDEVPLSTDTKFVTHRSVILDDKDGMLDSLPMERRIEDLEEDRKLFGNGVTKRRTTSRLSRK